MARRAGLGLLLVACGTAPDPAAWLEGEDPGPGPCCEDGVKATPDKDQVRADGTDRAVLSIRVDLTTDGQKPRTAQLTTKPLGLLTALEWDGGREAAAPSVWVPLQAGKGRAEFRCVDKDGQPVTGSTEVTAVVHAGDGGETSPPARLRCVLP